MVAYMRFFEMNQLLCFYFFLGLSSCLGFVAGSLKEWFCGSSQRNIDVIFFRQANPVLGEF